jgi:hypothetical protein
MRTQSGTSAGEINITVAMLKGYLVGVDQPWQVKGVKQ